MKTLGIIILIPIVLFLEIALTACTFTMYAMMRNGEEYMTEKLIDKL